MPPWVKHLRLLGLAAVLSGVVLMIVVDTNPVGIIVLASGVILVGGISIFSLFPQPAPETTLRETLSDLERGAVYMLFSKDGGFQSFVTAENAGQFPADLKGETVLLWTDRSNIPWIDDTAPGVASMWVEFNDDFITRDENVLTCSGRVKCLFRYTYLIPAHCARLRHEGDLSRKIEENIRQKIRDVLTQELLIRDRQEVMRQKGLIKLKMLIELVRHMDRTWGRWQVSLVRQLESVDLFIRYPDAVLQRLTDERSYRYGSTTTGGGNPEERPHLDEFEAQTAVNDLGQVFGGMFFDEFVIAIRVDGVRLQRLVDMGINFQGTRVHDLDREGVDYRDVPPDYMRSLGIVFD